MEDENLIESFFHCRLCVLEDAATNIAVGLTGDGAHLQVWCQTHQAELGMFTLKDPRAPMALMKSARRHGSRPNGGGRVNFNKDIIS